MASMMVSMPSVSLYGWGSVRLCVCIPLALLCCLSALWRVATYAFAVGVFDRTINMSLSDDGVWKRNVVGWRQLTARPSPIALCSAPMEQAESDEQAEAHPHPCGSSSLPKSAEHRERG
ncbi:hypothetical protein F7725_012996 [Dissostichus mawsoni]|uniref:Uncharacterized protein n=1 Tax=Dissostichus mawsoni TaxID=36200 RepID=A0A7J5YNV3_DISMA|nr:hypothetical protein F7725_012996 [Dissostichus mawsoni]